VFAHEIAGLAPLAIRSIKRTLRQGIRGEVELAIDREINEQNWLFRTADHREGTAALAEKRPPSSGRSDRNTVVCTRYRHRSWQDPIGRASRIRRTAAGGPCAEKGRHRWGRLTVDGDRDRRRPGYRQEHALFLASEGPAWWSMT